MRGARIGPAYDQPRRRRSAPHGKDHLSRRIAVAESVRDSRAGAAVRGRPEGARRQPRAQKTRARTRFYGQFRLRRGTQSRPVPRRRLYRRAAAHGALYAVQCENLRDLSEIRCARRYPRLFHRRSVHRRDELFTADGADRAGVRKTPHAGSARRDGHHGDGGRRHQSLSVQGRHGYRRKARRAR